MVENQHRQITGYRDLTQEEIDLMNEIKAHEATTAALHKKVADMISHPALTDRRHDNEIGERRRNAALARTEFENAFMRLVRCVAHPKSPWL